MQRAHRHPVPARRGFAGSAALVAALVLSGCPGTLDPNLQKLAEQPAGGSSGGSICTGDLDGASIVTSQCAISGCHDAADAQTLGAGLDLTVDSSIASRLVDVRSSGNSYAGSVCGSSGEAYLNSRSSPATGLLIQKIQSSPRCSSSESPPCCGTPMPYPGITLLTAQQQSCLIQWATTLTSP